MRDRLIALSSTNKQDGNLTAMQILAQKMNKQSGVQTNFPGFPRLAKKCRVRKHSKRAADLQNDLWNLPLRTSLFWLLIWMLGR